MEQWRGICTNAVHCSPVLLLLCLHFARVPRAFYFPSIGLLEHWINGPMRSTDQSYLPHQRGEKFRQPGVDSHRIPWYKIHNRPKRSPDT